MRWPACQRALSNLAIKNREARAARSLSLGNHLHVGPQQGGTQNQWFRVCFVFHLPCNSNLGRNMVMLRNPRMRQRGPNVVCSTSLHTKVEWFHLFDPACLSGIALLEVTSVLEGKTTFKYMYKHVYIYTWVFQHVQNYCCFVKNYVF